MIVGIAIDGSQHAERAFETYTNCWHREENTVLLLHALQVDFNARCEEMIVGDLTDLALNEKWKEVWKEAHPLQLRYEAKLKERGITGKWMSLEKGDTRACEAIVEAIEKNKLDYIVIGSHGRGALRSAILGSVSKYVLSHSPVPVIICRPDKAHKHDHRRKYSRGESVESQQDVDDGAQGEGAQRTHSESQKDGEMAHSEKGLKGRGDRGSSKKHKQKERKNSKHKKHDKEVTVTEARFEQQIG